MRLCRSSATSGSARGVATVLFAAVRTPMQGCVRPGLCAPEYTMSSDRLRAASCSTAAYLLRTEEQELRPQLCARQFGVRRGVESDQEFRTRAQHIKP